MTEEKHTAGHTPGPWLVDPAHPHFIIAPDGRASPWHVAGVLGGCGPGCDRTEANARLIASGPDLLAAGQALIRCDDTPDDADPGQRALAYEYAIRDLKRAISRATGAA